MITVRSIKAIFVRRSQAKDMLDPRHPGWNTKETKEDQGKKGSK